MAGYHLLQWILPVWRKKKVQNPIEELFYCIGCGVYIFYCMMNTCDGVIRWYFFMGLVVGEISGHIILCSLEKALKNLKKKSRKS